MKDCDEAYDIDITGLDKGAVLAALYNAAWPCGLGFLAATRGDMSVEEARKIYADQESLYAGATTKRMSIVWFDYVRGRPIKVGFDGDILRRYDLFDENAGPGKARAAVDSVRELNRASRLLTE